jgi:L-fuculose-phosphate aldolase
MLLRFGAIQELFVSVETNLRRLLSELGKMLSNRAMVNMAVGSLSARLDSKRILLTPAGVSFEFIHPENLQTVDLSQNSTNVLPLHRAVYEARPEIKAVIWARPPVTTALSMAGISSSQCLLPFELGSVEGEAEATLFTSQRLIELARRTNVILLERFGAITLGSTPEEAFGRMEALEQTSQITQITRSLSPVLLSKQQLDHKIALGNTLGFSDNRECNGCGGCGQPKTNIESEAVFASKVAAMFAQKPKTDEPIPFTLPPGRRATCGEAWWLEPEKK